MHIFSQPPIQTEGLSFEISELIMLRNWTENNGLRLELELDHMEGRREFEEFANLFSGDPKASDPKAGGKVRLVSLWRARTAVILVARNAVPRRFISMAHALAALHVQNGTIVLRQDRIGGP